MEKAHVLNAMAALSSGVRLDVYRLLVPTGRAGMVSGEIAAALDLPLTNTSFHLKALVQAGLATVEQQGRFQRYRANIPQMLAVIAFLTENCCANEPGACRAMRAAVPGVDTVLPALETSVD
jgi:ArsR family transcriptional regulator